MVDIQHRVISEGDIHQIVNWVWVDETARLAQIVTAEDVFKVGYQQSNQSLYILINTTPTWNIILNETNSTTPSGPAGGDLTGIYPDPEVVADSHNHTPGITIPAYPTTLPPSGAASSVDITGTYPNPILTTTGVTPGTYNRATVTVDSKGRISSILANTDPPPPAGVPFPGFGNVTLTGASFAETPPYSNNSTRIATTEYVTKGNIVYPVLPEGETLEVLPGYQKVVYGSYTVEDSVATPTTTLIIRGLFVITDDGQGEEGVEPFFTPYPNAGSPFAPTLVIPVDNFKIVPSGYFIQSPILVEGLLLVI